MLCQDDSCCARWRQALLEWSDIPLRLILAATFIAHGYPKLFGGLEGFAGFLGSLGVPAPGFMALVAASAEFGGGILMVLGLATRLAAFGHMAVMAVAIFGVHFSQGFQLTVVNNRVGGYEWQVALFCIAFCLLLRGAGPLSLDHLVLKCWQKRCALRQEKEKAGA